MTGDGPVVLEAVLLDHRHLLKSNSTRLILKAQQTTAFPCVEHTVPSFQKKS